MLQRLRIGIIGLGFGASVHLPAFQTIPGVEVVAVADSGSGRAIEKVAELGIKKIFHDWKHIINNKNIDAISVATPPYSQKEIVCAALSSGKHVLCEKPFGKDLNEALLMFELAKNSQLIHAVDFQFRMEPGIAELKRQVEAGAIGQVRRIDVTWLTGGCSDPSLLWSWRHDAELGGGVLNGFGSHVIDYVEWICRSSIVGVFARSHVLIRHRKDINGQARKVTAEDSCDLVCDLANGAIANLRLSNCYLFAQGHRIEIYGDRGRLVFTHEKPFTLDKMTLKKETSSGSLIPIEFDKSSFTLGTETRLVPFKRLAQLFVNSIYGNVAPDLPSFSCGLKVQRVMEAIKHSIKSQSLITIDTSIVT